jgi:predicted metal-dependent hydrolase
MRRHWASGCAAISYKDTKSRWGSCTSEGNLSFSWRIAMAPDHVIDYLAAHEVAHLKEMNHGPRFLVYLQVNFARERRRQTLAQAERFTSVCGERFYRHLA